MLKSLQSKHWHITSLKCIKVGEMRRLEQPLGHLGEQEDLKHQSGVMHLWCCETFFLLVVGVSAPKSEAVFHDDLTPLGRKQPQPIPFMIHPEAQNCRESPEPNGANKSCTLQTQQGNGYNPGLLLVLALRFTDERRSVSEMFHMPPMRLKTSFFKSLLKQKSHRLKQDSHLQSCRGQLSSCFMPRPLRPSSVQ